MNEILKESIAVEENMENMDQNTAKYEIVIGCVKNVLDSLIENPGRLDYTIDAMTDVLEKMEWMVYKNKSYREIRMYKKYDRYKIIDSESDRYKQFFTIVDVKGNTVYYAFDGEDSIYSFQVGSSFENEILGI